MCGEQNDSDTYADAAFAGETISPSGHPLGSGEGLGVKGLCEGMGRAIQIHRWRLSARRALPSRSCPTPKWIGKQVRDERPHNDHPRRADIRRRDVNDDYFAPRARQCGNDCGEQRIRLISRFSHRRGHRAMLRAQEGERFAAVGKGIPERVIRRGANGLRRTRFRQIAPARPPPLHHLKNGPLDGAARIGVAAEANEVNRWPPARRRAPAP